MPIELTIRRRGSLLSRLMERQINEDQARLVKTLLDCTDGLTPENVNYLEGSLNLTLYALGNGKPPWDSSDEDSVNGTNDYDAPAGAGDEVEAYRG